jgi:hypothetical protein
VKDWNEAANNGVNALEYADEAIAGRPALPKPSRIKLVAFNEIKATPEPPYLVREIIPRVGVVVIWGGEKCGKSFWVLDLDMHIALGWPYRGRRVQQGAVVYCCFEGQGGIAKRIEAFRQHHLEAHEGDVPFYLVTITLELINEHLELIEAIREQLAGVMPGDGHARHAEPKPEGVRK